MPGDDRRKIEKAATLGVDCICMDLEDGTALSKKAEARAVIAQAVKDLDFGKSERCIRINSVGSGFERDDLPAALAARPDTIVVPKVESAEQVKWVSGEIESYELAHSLPLGGIRLAICETIGGLAAFILLLEILGFLLSIALLTAFLLRVVEREGWLTTLTVAVANSGALYIIFKVMLGVSLPKNMFGF